MRFFRLLKPWDWILFIAIMLSSLLVFIYFTGKIKAPDKDAQGIVSITKNGRPYGSFDLNEDRLIDMGSNVIAIKDGFVYMEEADCKNQICVNTGKISAPGQNIVCLPNRIIVTITGKEEGFDAVAK